MALALSTKLVNDMLTTGSLKSIMEAAGGGNGFKIAIFGTSRPAAADTASGGAPLVTITAAANAPCVFEATATDGVILKAVAQDWGGTIASTGTAVWFRVYRFNDDPTLASTTLPRFDGSCSSGASSDMVMGSLTLTAAAPFIITDASFTLPKG